MGLFFKKMLILFVASGNIAYGFSQSILNEEDKSIGEFARSLKGEKGYEEALKILNDDKKDNSKNASDWLKQMKNNQSHNEVSNFMDELSKSNSIHKQFHDQRIHEEMSSALGGNFNTLIFVSYSLGEYALKEILENASHNKNAVVILRGIPKDTSITEGILKIQELAQSLDPVPNVMIQPNLFRIFRIERVPTIVQLSESTNHALASIKEATELAHLERARVSGLTSQKWLLERLEKGENGDFGERGDTQPIHEQDLIEVMKERVLDIDWKEKKEKAVKRAWDNVPFYELPKATKNRVRLIDPTITLNQDIKDAKGNIVVAQGTTVNPLHMRPFDFAIIIFDPLDKRQFSIVQETSKQLEKDSSINQVLLIATRIDRSRGSESFSEISNILNSHFYMLSQDIIDRFKVQHAPSVITANKTHFVVTEIQVQNEQGEENE